MANVNALGDAIGATPKGDIGALLAGTPTERGKESRGQLPALLRGKSEAEADVRRREMDIQQEELAKTAEAEKQYGRTLRQIDYGITQLEKPREAFVAPALSASDYAANAAMRLVTGLALGGIGKMSAIGQLKAIKAMQDAEDANQTEQFEQAKREFDQADAQRRDFNQRLKERVERLREGLKSDRAAAMVEAKLIAAETRDGLLAAQIRSGELSKALDTAERMIAQSDALDRQLAQEQRALDEKMRQEEAQRIEKIRQEEAQEAQAVRRATEARSLEELKQAGALERVQVQERARTEREALKPPPGSAKAAAEKEKREEAQKNVSDIITNLRAAYSQLRDRGAIVNTDAGAVQNLIASVVSSLPAQYVQGWIGTESQSIRQTIENTRPLLLATIKDAMGLGAKSLDSNLELKFYLQAATDPRRDLQSNMAALKTLQALIGFYQREGIAAQEDPDFYDAAVTAFGGYEPQKYEYRFMDGAIQRRLRTNRPELEEIDGEPQ